MAFVNSRVGPGNRANYLEIVGGRVRVTFHANVLRGSSRVPTPKTNSIDRSTTMEVKNPLENY